MSSSEDEYLQRAIALSLGSVDDIAGDEPFSAAAAADNSTSEATPAQNTDSAANKTQLSSARAVNESLRNCDRKQLEAARLARQNARKHQSAETSPFSPQHGRPAKRVRTEAGASPSREPGVIDLTATPSPRKPVTGGSPRQSSPARSQGETLQQILQEACDFQVRGELPALPISAPSRTIDPNKITDPEYLDGAVKRTWARGFSRDNDIKIEELLRKDDLKHLLVSTFQFDTEWWSTKIDPHLTKQTWMVGSTSSNVAADWKLAPVMYPNVSVSLADMTGFGGNYHAKFIIGAHPKYLRVAITSANLTEWDWGESGVMENTVFVIDLPRLPEGQTTSEDDFTPFGQELRRFIHSVTHRPNLCNSLLKFDWSRTKHLAFVHSLRGQWTGEDAQRTGLPGLSRAIKQLNLGSTTLEVDYATSSLGALNRNFMKQVLDAAKGEAVKVEKVKKDQDAGTGDILNSFRVHYPSRDTVRTSKGGPSSGGTITLAEKWYDAASFPRAAMHDHKSTRDGLLSHSKIIVGRGQRASPNVRDGDSNEAGPREKVAWAYIGSANLTAAAWGQLSTDRATKTLKVTCRNYECGVIVPVNGKSLEKQTREEAVPGYDVFKGTMDIPFEVPGVKLGNKLPWCYAGY